MEHKKIFVILGMHRSGTSVITKGLGALGVNLGTHLKEAGNWNPKGFWEDTETLDLNERILDAFGYTWKSLSVDPNFDPNDSRLSPFHLLANNILLQRFQNTNCWGFKDPRTSRLLPFWKKQFATLNIEDSYIIAIRNPLSTTKSLENKAKMDIEKSMLLWLLHMVPAINNTMGKKRVIVSYELLMQNPMHQLNRIKKSLAIHFPTDQQGIDNYTNQFLSKNLTHYTYNEEDFKTHPEIPKLCYLAYDLLNQAAQEKITLDDEVFLSSWKTITDNLYHLMPFYKYVDDLINKNIYLLDVKNSYDRIIRYLTLNGLVYKPVKLIFRTLKYLIENNKKKPVNINNE